MLLIRKPQAPLPHCAPANSPLRSSFLPQLQHSPLPQHRVRVSLSPSRWKALTGSFCFCLKPQSLFLFPLWCIVLNPSRLFLFSITRASHGWLSDQQADRKQKTVLHPQSQRAQKDAPKKLRWLGKARRRSSNSTSSPFPVCRLDGARSACSCSIGRWPLARPA